jgi:hypothetical protein
MKRLDINQTSIPLARLAHRKEPTVFTDEGKDVAVLYPVRECDRESLSLSMNPRFMAIINRSRARTKPGTGISSDELRRQLGIQKKAK